MLLHKTKWILAGILAGVWVLAGDIGAYSGFIPPGTESLEWPFGSLDNVGPYPVRPLGVQTDFPFSLKPVVCEHHLELGYMNISCRQGRSAVTIRECMCVHAGWKSLAPSTDGCEGSNHNSAEKLLTLWARALQAKENLSENKQPLG